MLLPILGFFLGIALLSKLSDYAVDISVKLSKLTGIIKLTIGIIVIALMTSLPELAITITSSISKVGKLAYGTMVGSNIADILLVLGAASAIYGINISKRNIIHATEIIVITSGLLAYGFFYGYDIVFGFLGIIIFGLLADRLLHKKTEQEAETSSSIGEIIVTLTKLVVVIIFILLSAELVTRSVIEISNYFGISETLIGATIIGITTSLPELAVVLSAAKKKENEIVFGTIFGSCFINISLVLGIGALISPILIGFRETVVFVFLLFTYIVTLLFMKYKLERFEGVIMLFIYALFVLLMASLG